MKKYLVLALMIGFSLQLTSQSTGNQTSNKKYSLYAGVGYQYYSGDLGKGFYRVPKKCTWGVISLGLDYKIQKSLDLKILGTIGAMGYLQPSKSHTHTHEHEDNPRDENLNSRLTAGIVALQYRFANGYILAEDSKFSPSLYLGGGINYISDPMKMECVNVGVYSTINGGGTLKYKTAKSFTFGLRFDFGYFMSDNLDFIDENINDLHMQNSVIFGYDF